MRLRRYLFDMKSSEFRELLENSLYNEVKNRIITESEEGNYDVFEVVCEGEPFEVCKTKEEAQEIVNKLEKQHPGKQFIIEKKTYKSYENMLDELDEMGEELQEKENQDMKNNKVKVGSLAEAILHAKENNKSKIVINEEVIDVNEKWKEMEEEETCEQCSMEEDDETKEGDYGSDYDNLPDGDETFVDEMDLTIGNDPSFDYDIEKVEKEGSDLPLKKKKSFFSRLNDKFNDSLGDYEPDYHEKFMGMAEGDESQVCSECGTGELNEEGQCNECGYMKESTKKKLRLKESELVSLIRNMVTEAAKGEPGIPGIPGVTVTKKAQSGSKKENEEYAKELSTKLKNYLNFDGNDNPEFPKPIGKGDKMAFRNTSENEKKIEDKRGETASDLSFDYEPSEGFKQRIKKSLEGDSTMGNSSDAGNVVKDKVGSKIVDKTKRKIENNKKKKEVSWGHSWENPSDARIVKESNNKLSNILKEELEKINKLSFYNKKTQ
jgi:hypothetical protein